MDLLLAVLGSIVAVIIVATILVSVRLYRKHNYQQTRANLTKVHDTLSRIDNALNPYLCSKQFIPERISRPLRSELKALVEWTLPSLEKSVRRTHDSVMIAEFQSVSLSASRLRQDFVGQNYHYVQRAVTEHSKLLIGELNLDSAQREATVQDDERNLVIAAAGSGKTRTLIARVRYLLESGAAPSHILAITFTNKATEEMEDRLKQMGVPIADRENQGVTVSTLHALGKRIVQANMPEPISVADGGWVESLVAAALRDAREARDQKLGSLYLNAVLNFHRNLDERTAALGADLTYRTLRGERVRSIGERIIADFLLTHNISYKYEAKASWAQVGAGRSAYHPDFTLLDSGACIEYWGTDRSGNVPASWATSSSEYNQRIAWKREEFRRTGRKLIEFYDYERTEGNLEGVIPTRLAASGIEIRSMTLSELEGILRDTKYIGSVIEQQLVQFIANARSFRMPREQILQRLQSVSPRVFYFGVLGIAVLQRYEKALASEGRIDFSDMLHRAADIIEKGPNSIPKFRHVLVDEFQDTSAPMARLVNALVRTTGTRLFAVGDDWQAIYGFAGGDVDHVLNFESHFGPASLTMLNTNYRSPRIIVEAGSALISHNTKQIPKQVMISSQERGEVYVHEVPDDDLAIVKETIRLMQEESSRTRPGDILVLSRTNHLLRGIREGCALNMIPLDDPDRNVSGVRVLSAHKAKGLEASVVILMNASDDLFGFPSKMENLDTLEPVRTSAVDDQAEERRLFYVAVTRARKRLHLIQRKGLPSPYIAEIEGTGRPAQIPNSNVARPGVRFGDTFFVDQIYHLSDRQLRSGIRQAGILTTSSGQFLFTSWMPIHLVQGGTYRLSGVVCDQLYHDKMRVKFDRYTRIERRLIPQPTKQTNNVRQLCPRPPPDFQPRLAIQRDPMIAA